MNETWGTHLRLTLALAFASAAALVPAWGAPQHAPDGGQKAAVMLKEFGARLSAALSYSIDIAATRTLTRAGIAEQTTMTARGWVKPPNKLLWVTQGPAGAGIHFCNGTSTTVFRPALGKYAVRKLEPGEDAWLEPVDTQFGEKIASLLSPSATTRSAPGMTEDLGMEVIAGKPCVHFRGGGTRTPWELWMCDTSGPLPAKMRLAAQAGAKSGSTSAPQQTVTELAMRWDLSLNLHDSTFEFKPPAGARFVETFAEAAESTDSLPVGAEVPNLSLAMPDGKAVPLAQLRGKSVVVLDFWATWCHGCEKAMTDLAAITKKYEGKPVIIFAINVKEDPEMARKFLEQRGLSLNTGFDPQGAAAGLFRVHNIPRTFVIGKDGKIQSVIMGFSETTKDDLAKAIDAAMK